MKYTSLIFLTHQNTLYNL